MKQALAAIKFYQTAKAAVIAAGFEKDIEWQSTRNLDSITESEFLQEAAWVILNSGMKFSVCQMIWPALRRAFQEFRSAQAMSLHRSIIRANVLKRFNNDRKVDAVLEIARRVTLLGWNAMRERIARDGIDYLVTLPFIGDITKYHLAKSLGVDIAKPDRHLQRTAAKFGFEDVQEFCRIIAAGNGDRVCVVDIVIWRFCEQGGCV